MSFVDLLATQSPYIRLDADRRSRLFDGVARLIERRLNGTASKSYLAMLDVLAVARRPHVGRERRPPERRQRRFEAE